MKWFKMKEFECHCGCRMPDSARANIAALVEQVLDPARERLGRPVRVNSGYRCAKHNREVGGVSASQHLRGEAADIAPAGFRWQDSRFNAELERLVGIIKANGRFDQLIVYPTFVHVSWKRIGKNRKQIIYKQH